MRREEAIKGGIGNRNRNRNSGDGSGRGSGINSGISGRCIGIRPIGSVAVRIFAVVLAAVTALSLAPGTYVMAATDGVAAADTAAASELSDGSVMSESPDSAAMSAASDAAGARDAAGDKTVQQVLGEAAAYMVSANPKPQFGSEWFVLGLARGGMPLDDPYFSTYYENVVSHVKEVQGVLHERKYTEYSRLAVALTAIGRDARDVGGYSLLEKLSDFDKTCWQGINGPIWALIAVDARDGYEFSEMPEGTEQSTREKLISAILEQECEGGGWSLGGITADPDITGMALQALAPYYRAGTDPEVTAAADRALSKLSELQMDDGGFASWGTVNSESCAQVLTALCSLGIDPDQDSRFIKGGHTLEENLMSYQVGDLGFMHIKPGTQGNGGGAAGELNGMATEQAYYALVAYQRLKDGKSALYDMDDAFSHSDPQAGKKVTISLNGQNVTGKKLPAQKGKTYALSAAAGQSGEKISFSTSDKKVATVTADGRVKIKKASGAAKITARTDDGRQAVVTFKATSRPVLATSIKVSGAKAMSAGERQKLGVIISPATASQKAAWSTSNAKVAAISKAGIVTAKKKGTVTITASARDGSGKKAKIKINIK